MISMNPSLSDRAFANQAFLEALEQLDETFGESTVVESIQPLNTGDLETPPIEKISFDLRQSPHHLPLPPRPTKRE